MVEKVGQSAEDVGLRTYDAIQFAAAVSVDIDDLVVVAGGRGLASAAQTLGIASISDLGTST